MSRSLMYLRGDLAIDKDRKRSSPYNNIQELKATSEKAKVKIDRYWKELKEQLKQEEKNVV